MSAHLSAAQIKSRLDHPIIDADGHWVEYGPVFTEQLRKVGGEDAVRGWNAVGGGTRGVLSMSVEERRRRRISQEAFWGHPSKNTRDLATAHVPAPARRAARRDRPRFRDHLSDRRACACRGSATASAARAAVRAYNIVTAEYFAAVRATA